MLKIRKAYILKLLSLLTDAFFAVISLFLTLLIARRFNVGEISPVTLFYVPICVAVVPLCLYLFGIHRISWRHACFRDVMRTSTAVILGVLITLICTLIVTDGRSDFTLIEVLCTLQLSVCASVCMRMAKRHFAIKAHRSQRIENSDISRDFTDYGKSIIIGAGYTAEILLRSLTFDANFSKCEAVALIDDNPEKHNTLVRGVPVMGGREDIPRIVQENQIKTIFFAIPSASREQRKDILKICSGTGCDVRVMPSIDESLDVSDPLSKMRKVSISDLLGRESIKMDVDRVCGYVEGKVVLVTGGGGSIGSELCRQIAARNPKKLIIFDIYENNAYDILNELKRSYPTLDVLALIGSVRDEERIDSVFSQYHPDIVYHAAAHKHVPLMEDSPHEAVKNNVFGTLNTVRAADKHGTKRFVMISTDKAVNPTNIMGTTKRVCEMIIQTYNRRSKTEFVAVRFGNVLGSNGSVIPLFERQIASGGPVTVTHPNIIRYFMTIPEAVSLVLTAGAFAKGGEIFILDMGDPVKIVDLAENMIRLSGFEPYHDIDIKFTGLRPGEKLYEELLMDEEGLQRTENSLIYVGRPIELDEERLFPLLEELREAASDDKADVRAVLHKVVPTFKENT